MKKHDDEKKKRIFKSIAIILVIAILLAFISPLFYLLGGI